MDKQIESTPKSSNKLDRKTVEKLILYPAVVLMGIFIIWLIFTPNSKEEAKTATGFNLNVPEAMQEEMSEDKKDAYNKDVEKRKNIEREQIKSLAKTMIEQQQLEIRDTQQSQVGNSVQPNETATEKVVASTNAYRDINRTLDGFYTTPKVDKKEGSMQRELDSLKNELLLREQKEQNVEVDDQIAIMEKSYELAAKYMPKSSEQTSSKTTTKEVEDAKKIEENRAKTVRDVKSKVVSTLSTTSDSAFVAEFSKSRNLGFNTAVGSDAKAERNTISAVIHSSQTIIDGGVVKIRITEAMSVEGKILPKNSIITGNGKIQGDRLYVTITNLEYQGFIIPVELTVMDGDGLKGVFIPSSMEINALKEVAANLGSNLGTTINLNQQSAGGQILTDAGKGALQGVSQYVNKKMQEVKIHLKAGHRVMLYNQNN